MVVAPASTRRALPFRRPSGPHRPRPFETAVKRLEEHWKDFSSTLWAYIAEHAPVYGPGGDLLERDRELREDGARNLCTLLQTAVMNASAAGFLGSPERGHWKRLSVGLLDIRAFGERVENERSLRRTERWLRALKHMGLITIREIRIKRRKGFESVVAVKHLTEKFWRLIGLWNQLEAEQQRQKAEADKAKKREDARNRGHVVKPITVHDGDRRRGPEAPPTAPAAKPPDPGPPADVRPAAETIQELQQRFRFR